MTGACPTCGQPLLTGRKAKRICFDCRHPILKGHKHHLAERQGVLTPVHRCCERPDRYAAAPGEPAPAPLFDAQVAHV